MEAVDPRSEGGYGIRCGSRAGGVVGGGKRAKYEWQLMMVARASRLKNVYKLIIKN